MTQLARKCSLAILSLLLIFAFDCTTENLPVLETGSIKPMPVK